MSQKSIKGTRKLGEAIRSRRQELGLTIEEAAFKAGVGVKSWCRYESGESIRKDKVKGICKALGWLAFPNQDASDEPEFDITYFKNHAAWSPYLCECFGEGVAISFVAGSEILSDNIEEDLMALSEMPRGSHIGQLPVSTLKGLLPEQFLMRYDYDFLYLLKTTVAGLTATIAREPDFLAHSVLEELAIYLIMEEATAWAEILSAELETSDIDGLDRINDWVYDLFDDMDIVTFLFSGIYLPPQNTYHFDNWTKKQFYVHEDEDEDL